MISCCEEYVVMIYAALKHAYHYPAVMLFVETPTTSSKCTSQAESFGETPSCPVTRVKMCGWHPTTATVSYERVSEKYMPKYNN